MVVKHSIKSNKSKILHRGAVSIEECIYKVNMAHMVNSGQLKASPDGSAVWGVVVSTRWWLLVDHCVLRNWGRILVRALKGLISRAGMVSICPLLWQRDVKLQQTRAIKKKVWTQMVFWGQIMVDKTKLEHIITWPNFNFSCKLGQIMTRYDFLWARWVILSNVRTDLNLT